VKNNKFEVMTWHLMQLNQNAVQLKKKPKRKKVFLKNYGVSFLDVTVINFFLIFLSIFSINISIITNIKLLIL